MIGSLRGSLLHKEPGHVLLEVSGIGYEVNVPVALFESLPDMGQEVQLFVVESMAMYGGGVTLYGFSSREDKEIYLLLREIPGTGSKKALEYLDKIAKSSPDFRRAILDNDIRTLVSLFGFTKKTAEKMVVSLKERLAGLRLAGKEKFATAVAPETSEAIAALIQLGYREREAREAIERLPATVRSSSGIPDLVKEALKALA